MTYTIVAISAAIAIIALTYLTSQNFSTRINEAVDEIVHYEPQESRTSLGMRFDWWHNSITLIKEKPVWGHGTGSFEKVQGELVKGTKTKASDNPHNEYLLLGVQTGLVGAALFLLLLLALFTSSFYLTLPQRYLLQGVVIAMGAGCVFNSFLLDSHQGHFFAFLSAALSVGARQGDENASETV